MEFYAKAMRDSLQEDTLSIEKNRAVMESLIAEDAGLMRGDDFQAALNSRKHEDRISIELVREHFEMSKTKPC